MLPNTLDARLARAHTALVGLSVGDAFGQNVMNQFRWRDGVPNADATLYFTDDTNMALSIYAILRQQGEIDQDALAASFAEHFDIQRGYGGGAQRLLRDIQNGADWRKNSRQMFGGTGSFGNGAAMRIAPLGAYFADDLDRLTSEAEKASEITHAHPEGIAGGVAVALATGIACRLQAVGDQPTRAEFIDQVLKHLPDSATTSRIRRAKDINPATGLQNVVAMLGNGSQISAMDTVPFVLWSAGEKLDHFEEAIYLTAQAGGDVDTTCAMVGGIVAAYCGHESIPTEWIRRREALPDWPF